MLVSLAAVWLAVSALALIALVALYAVERAGGRVAESEQAEPKGIRSRATS